MKIYEYFVIAISQSHFRLLYLTHTGALFLHPDGWVTSRPQNYTVNDVNYIRYHDDLLVIFISPQSGSREIIIQYNAI